MSLKELTAEKHQQAESTRFMKAVFAKTLPADLWMDFTYQKTLFYKTIEGIAGACRLLNDLPDVSRAFKINQDYQAMTRNTGITHSYRRSTIEYNDYLLTLYPDANRIMAHLYTWHMGDLFGGQMIKKIVDAPHSSLDFSDARTLMKNIRAKLDDSMGEEANVAFSWAIKLMESYDSSLG